MKKNLKETKPLDLSKRETKIWEELDYKCMVLIDEDLSNIKKVINTYLKELFTIYREAFVVIWNFDGGITQSYYKNIFDSLSLISERNDYLLYKVSSASEGEKLIANWGEYDILDIIFSKETTYWEDIFSGGFYKSYRHYRKNFIKRVQNVNAIISDSGDGEEVELIFSNEIYV